MQKSEAQRARSLRPICDAEMTGLARGAGILAWRQIADALEAEILAGVAAPGARLPTEAALAARFDVNRHTLRRAVAALAAKGLVRATRGSGTFVEERVLPYPIGARTRFSEIVAGRGREPGGRLLAAEAGPASAETARRLGLSEGAPVLRVATLRSADGVPLSFATAHLPLPRFAGLPALLEGGGTMSAAFARFGAGDYVRGETRITARPGRPDETERLELAPGRVVLVAESVDVDASGTPIQAAVSVFAADRVEIVIEGPDTR